MTLQTEQEDTCCDRIDETLTRKHGSKALRGQGRGDPIGARGHLKPIGSIKDRRPDLDFGRSALVAYDDVSLCVIA